MLSPFAMSSSCVTCLKTKANLTCGLCAGSLCKKCAEFLAEETFSFLKTVPAELAHSTYCGNCFGEHVAPAQLQYDETMEAARNVMIFMKSQAKETRLIKRKEPEVKVTDCADHDETIMRLAFYAAQLKFNALIDVLITPKKVVDGHYQTTVYTGSGIPAQVHESKLIKDRSLWSNPN